MSIYRLLQWDKGSCAYSILDQGNTFGSISKFSSLLGKFCQTRDREVLLVRGGFGQKRFGLSNIENNVNIRAPPKRKKELKTDFLDGI